MDNLKYTKDLVEEIKSRLAKTLSPRRYKHTLGVAETAEKLARHYGCNAEKAALAGLLHDCARDIRGPQLFDLCDEYGVEVTPIYRAQPELLHGLIAAKLIRREYGIDDPEIENAVRIHTTGSDNMSLLDKVLFLADLIEPGRDFPGVDELRNLAWQDLDEAILLAIDRTIKYVLDKRDALIHPDTIHARNAILLKRRPV